MITGIIKINTIIHIIQRASGLKVSLRNYLKAWRSKSLSRGDILQQLCERRSHQRTVKLNLVTAVRQLRCALPQAPHTSTPVAHTAALSFSEP